MYESLLWQFNVWEIHPILTHFPIALLLAGVAADIFAAKWNRETWRQPAAGLLLAGVIAGWLAAGAGLLSFFTVPAHTAAAESWMWWHLGIGVAMLLLFTWIAVRRWRNRLQPASASQMRLQIVAAFLLVVTSWLGGALVYRGGAGVEPELLTEEIRHGHSHHSD